MQQNIVRPEPSVAIVWVETLEEGISEPFLSVGKSHKELFDEHPRAQALWIMGPSMREPYRINWRYGMYGAGANRRP